MGWYPMVTSKLHMKRKNIISGHSKVGGGDGRNRTDVLVIDRLVKAALSCDVSLVEIL